MSLSDSTALILVDVTNSFYLKGMPNFYPEAQKTLEPLRRLLEAARAKQRIVVHAAEQHRADSTIMNGRSCRSIISSAQPMLLSSPASSRRDRASSCCPSGVIVRFFATDLALFLHEQKICARGGGRR